MGETPIYGHELTDKLRLVFHGFQNEFDVKIILNEKTFDLKPKPWEIIEFEEKSQEIKTFLIEYKGQKHDFTKDYEDIMMNQVYYNHRP